MGYLFLACASIAVLARLKVTDSAGVIQIKLLQYTNIIGWKSGNPNQCCDVMSADALQCRSQPCDPYFDFCLQNMTHSECGLGRRVTGYTRDQDNIVFGDKIGHNNTGNPMFFPVSQFFDNQMTVMVTVYDEDKTEGNLKQTNDKIDYMQQVISYTPDFNGKHKTTMNFTLSGKVSSLSIQVNFRCGTFYYGNSCTKRCRSDKRTYDCDSNGDRTCLPGWTGSTCATNVDECANNSCQNGATCKDDINNYICECSANFTGRYCESMITTSTAVPPTTTTTAAAATPTSATTTATTKGTTVTSTFSTSTVTPTLPFASNSAVITSSIARQSPTKSSVPTLSTPVATTPHQTTSQHVSNTIQTSVAISTISSQLAPQTTVAVTQSSTTNSSNLTSKIVSPKASQFGQRKMSEPESSDGTPGPLIGGVFGGLLVAAGLVVIGFFVYKRKREKEKQQPVKDKQDDKISTGPRDSGDGKSVHDASEELGDTKIDVDDRVYTQDTPRNVKFSNELQSIDF